MDIEIKELDSMRTHRYLGEEENRTTEHNNEKKKEYIRKLKLILKTGLS
jgi:hypothetical protein